MINGNGLGFCKWGTSGVGDGANCAIVSGVWIDNAWKPNGAGDVL